MTKVSTVMTTDIVSVPDDSTAIQAANMMLEKKVSSVVIKKGKEPVGIITGIDFVRMLSHGETSKGVTSYMSTELVTIAPDANLKDALVLMKVKNVRHLLVKEKEKYVGIISSKDCLWTLVEMEDMERMIKLQSERMAPPPS